MAEALFNLATTGATIWTPNRRLASFVEASIYQQCAEQGQSITPAFSIFPLQDWLLQSWQQTKEKKAWFDHPICISNLQQQLLFEQIIEQSDWTDGILKAHITAGQVTKAWNDCIAWEIELETYQDLFIQTIDTRAFWTWAQAYQQQLTMRGWLDRSLMINEWLIWAKQGWVEWPKQIAWVGFHDLNPQLQRIKQVLTESGVRHTELHLTVAPTTLCRVVAPTPNAELEAVALWAKQKIEDDADARIGIVIPDLVGRRNQVTAILGEHLSEQEVNISAPLPLNRYPLIQHVLALLGLCQAVFQHKDLSYCLRSSFFWPEEQLVAHQVDTLLQPRLEPTLDWQTLLHWLESDMFVELRQQAPGWFACMTQLATESKHFSGSQTASQWFVHIQNLLDLVQWPGLKEATQVENHLLAGWQQVLQEYLKLDALLGRHPFHVTCNHLQRLTANLGFLPESKTRKVHVLGLLEALGLPFDHLWVVGMARSAWPMEPKPNPFIPITLQKQCLMPRSSSERELILAQQMTETFKQSGKDSVIFSHALMQDDEPQGASQLIADIALNMELGQTSQRLAPAGKMSLETYSDEQGLPVQAHMLMGGTQLLKWQAQCPMHAYLRYRCQAKDWVVPDISLQPFEKGLMLHSILQAFWQQYRTQAKLKLASQAQVRDALSRIIQRVVAHWKHKKPTTLHFLDGELTHDSLLELVMAWLQIEQCRAPFQIHDLEQKRLLNIGQVQLQIQIDRIDTLEDGQKVMIDYKTGRTKMSEWFEARCIDPQLPLYSLVEHPSARAIAFAEIRWDGLRFQGVSAHDEMLPQVKSIDTLQNTDWDSQKQEWHNRLLKLTEEFIQGVAKRAPRDGHLTCRQCHLKMVCRIHEEVS